ncbi:MAG: alpha/beta hydrolase [Ferrimonas sp.]
MTQLLPVAMERQFQLEGICLAAQQWGDPQAPLILALHGWLDNSESFYPLVPYCVQGGYQVIALDLPGHGHSEHRGPAAQYGLMDYLYELHQVWLQLPVAPVCILGHSLGGIIAGLYCAAYPEHRAKLVCIEAMGPLTCEASDAPQQLRRGIESRLRARTPAPNLNLAQLVRARQALTDLPTHLLEPLLLRNLSTQQQGQYAWRSDPRLRQRSLMLVDEVQAQAYTSAITVPTLLILGDQGFTELKTGWCKRQHWFHHGQVQQISGGHHCHMTAPECCARALIHFLQS